MVYESDFYTTRRPYRPSPSVSSYTVSRYLPSRQIRILPGIGRVHVVHSYDRLIPYIGHKRLTIVSAPPHVIRVRPSIYIREIDRIQHKVRPYHYYSPTSSYLNSEPITFFDDETRLIRAQAQSLVKKIHAPLPRIRLSWPLYPKTRYHYEQPLTAKIISDDYVHRMLSPIQSVKSDIYRISHYVTDPIRNHLGTSHLACVRYGGDRAYSRRRNLTLREIYAMQSDTVRNDIQLLSYYINANKDRKALYQGAKASTTNLNAQRISRVWSKPQMMLEPSDEIKELREQRAERFRKIQETDDKPEVETKIKRSTKKEEERLAEERALAEEQAKKQQAAKKEEETRRAELARQEALAAQAAAERQAEIDRKAELARQEELNKKAEAERLAAEKAEKARLEAEKAQAEKARVEEEKHAAELARQEEERQQLLRLEELARQAEEEKEKELARQAEELAELARQEAELAELARKEAELAELAKQEELARQEQELAELDRQEREAADAGNEEVEEEVVEEAEVVAESEEAQEEAVDEDTAEPVVEEPETPEATESAPVAEAVEVDEEEEEE